MPMFKDEDQVEFQSTVSCRVIFPDTHVDRHMPSSLRIIEGTLGTVRPDAWDVLPGDVPVVILADFVDAAGTPRKQHVVVSARMGVLAEIAFEDDPESGDAAFKVYRNMRVAIPDRD